MKQKTKDTLIANAKSTKEYERVLISSLRHFTVKGNLTYILGILQELLKLHHQQKPKFDGSKVLIHYQSGGTKQDLTYLTKLIIQPLPNNSFYDEDEDNDLDPYPILFHALTPSGNQCQRDNVAKFYLCLYFLAWIGDITPDDMESYHTFQQWLKILEPAQGKLKLTSTVHDCLVKSSTIPAPTPTSSTIIPTFETKTSLQKFINEESHSIKSILKRLEGILDSVQRARTGVKNSKKKKRKGKYIYPSRVSESAPLQDLIHSRLSLKLQRIQQLKKLEKVRPALNCNDNDDMIISHLDSACGGTGKISHGRDSSDYQGVMTIGHDTQDIYEYRTELKKDTGNYVAEVSDDESNTNSNEYSSKPSLTRVLSAGSFDSEVIDNMSSVVHNDEEEMEDSSNSCMYTCNENNGESEEGEPIDNFSSYEMITMEEIGNDHEWDVVSEIGSVLSFEVNDATFFSYKDALLTKKSTPLIKEEQSLSPVEEMRLHQLRNTNQEEPNYTMSSNTKPFSEEDWEEKGLYDAFFDYEGYKGARGGGKPSWKKIK